MKKKFGTIGAAALLATPTGLSGAADGPLDQVPQLVTLEPISVPIIDGDRVNGHLSYTLVIEAENAEAKVALDQAGARMRSVSLGTGLEFARLYASSFSAVDAKLLSDRLNDALRGSEPGIARVLLVQVSARPS